MLAVLPLLLKGPSCGHDFEFHVRNWLEVSSQWKQGVLFPHWEFTAAWNSGEPRFIFYPPLSWTVGAFLGLLLPWAAVPATYIWLALLSCGFTMFHLARQWTPCNNALIAAAFYMVHPYMLFTFYERAAYAELLAAAWMPLLMLAILRPRLSVFSIALPICLIWLTNAPAAVMGCYTFALLALIRIVSTGRKVQGSKTALQDAAKIASGAILGIGLAAFYILPAAFEQHWVQINMPFIKGVRYQDNFFFGHLGEPSHVAILRTVSLCGVALLVLAAIFTAIALHSRRREPKTAAAEHVSRKRTILALALLTCCIAFLLTSPSAVLWRHIPELIFLQFPWRFCAILGATTAALLALAMPRTALHPTGAVAIAMALTLVFTLGGNYFFRQYCHPASTVPSIVNSFYKGGHFDPTDEYTPIGADPMALQHFNPPYWIAATPTDPAPQTAAGDYSIALARRLHFLVSIPAPRFIVLSLRDYRAWKITVNGTPIEKWPHRSDGLIALPIAGGISKIDITYARTPDQAAGWFLTALSAASLLFVSRKRQQNT